MITKFFDKTWEWLDKKKTVIGSISLMLSEIVTDPNIKVILKSIGILFGATGVAHKIIKNDLGKF